MKNNQPTEGVSHHHYVLRVAADFEAAKRPLVYASHSCRVLDVSSVITWSSEITNDGDQGELTQRNIVDNTTYHNQFCPYYTPRVY